METQLDRIESKVDRIESKIDRLVRLVGERRDPEDAEITRAIEELIADALGEAA
jgi:hypothetical protein